MSRSIPKETEPRKSRRGRPYGKRKTLGLVREVVRDQPTLYLVAARTNPLQARLNESDICALGEMTLRQAAFCGIDVLAYSITSTVLQALVRVPLCPYSKDGNHGIDDAELLRRHSVYYADFDPPTVISFKELETVLAMGGEAAEIARGSILWRMGDLSIFMKELKQRYTFLYNRSYDTYGTIWAERFRSVIIEDEAAALALLSEASEEE